MNDLMRTMTFVTEGWAGDDRRALNFPCSWCRGAAGV